MDLMVRVTLIYDGECPFCSRYARFVRLKRAVGHLKLVDARTDEADVVEARARGFDLDDGMTLVIGDTYYHGADCLNRLALMSSRSDSFNRLNFLLFRSARFSGICYPLLRAGRNLTLRVLGRPKMGH